MRRGCERQSECSRFSYLSLERVYCEKKSNYYFYLLSTAAQIRLFLSHGHLGASCFYGNMKHQVHLVVNVRFLEPLTSFTECVSLSRRRRSTGEATVDLPRTRDTTFPRSSPLPWNHSERAPSVVQEVNCILFGGNKVNQIPSQSSPMFSYIR